MLPPKPRILKVIEHVDPTPAKSRISKTDRRYPHRRGLERATQSFVIYLLVAGQFSDLASPSTKQAEQQSLPSSIHPE